MKDSYNLTSGLGSPSTITQTLKSVPTWSSVFLNFSLKIGPYGINEPSGVVGGKDGKAGFGKEIWINHSNLI